MEARKVDRQFLLGSSLLVSPVLEKVMIKDNFLIKCVI
jgi:alpha-glucosidase (family GH31 glycosyl hydrolase)